jgi:shikimate kinase
MNQRFIVITGFMGSGKTTVARALGGLLGFTAMDLDELVTRSEKRSPNEILDQDGEDKFREIETRVLSELLKKESAGVTALGGGTWTIRGNRKLLAEHDAITIWLDAPFELCWNRIEASRQKRPLAPSYETARKRYQERLKEYAQASFSVVISEGESSDEIARRIAALISPDGANR